MIRLRLLGSIDLQDDQTGRELRAVLAQPKRLALLAYLAAASPIGSHRRDTLLGLFWPELDQDHARNALSKAVQFLRQSLGDTALIPRTSDELALNPECVWVDVRAYQEHLREERLEEALELYQGDLLPSFFVSGAAAFEEWLERERASLRALASAAARTLAGRHELARHPTLALAWARRAAELANGDERQVRRLIELLDRLGDRAGAVRTYEEFARKLSLDLDVAPSPETTALINRVRAAEHRPLSPGAGPGVIAETESALNRLSVAVANRYKVERQLGAGAMAVVFLAHDLRHHRRVAIKVLRPELTPLMGTERFLREIDITAGLMHPHILPVHDSGEADGLLYYVMPYVEGGSLRGRLEREHRLPLDDVLQLGIEVADALAYAHHRGFIHRDIKPENILLGAGHSLVADFGIARAIEAIGDEASARGLATGTPAYMSPEQASGQGRIDGRTDVFALGCVLHEMLSGQQPFPTVDVTPDTGRFNRPVPQLSSLSAEVSPNLGTVITKALARAPEERFARAGDLAAALRREAGAVIVQRAMALGEGARSDGVEQTTPSDRLAQPQPRSGQSARHASRIAAGGLVLALLAAMNMLWLKANADIPRTGLGTATQVTFEPGFEIEPSLSPDGRFVAYSAPTGTGTRLYVRQPGGRALPVTPESEPGQRRPLWSPDGTKLLFLNGPDLAIVPALGGNPSTIVRGGRSRAAVDAAPAGWRDGVLAATWAPDGRQVAYAMADSVYLVQVDGSQRRAVAKLEDVHSLAWAPDGRRIALATGNTQYEGGEIGMLGNGGISEILIIGADAPSVPVTVTGRSSLNASPVWTPDGKHLLFVSDRHGPRDVYQIRVDASGRPQGEPNRVTTGLDPHTIALSANGERLAYSSFTIRSNVWSVPISLRGPAAPGRAVPLTTGTQYIEGLVLSPNSNRLYFASNQQGNFDIYRLELPEGEAVQVTHDPAHEWEAQESPDGQWLAFYSLRYGTRDVFVMPVGGGSAERVTSDPGEERYPTWSPDGTTISYTLDDSPKANGTFVVSRNPNGGWGLPRQVSSAVAQSVWSQDGGSIVMVVQGRILAVPVDGQAPRQLYSPRVASSDPIPVHVFGRFPNAGGFLPFISVAPQGDSFWGLPERGGRPRLMARINELTNVNGGTGMRGYQTDGQRFYFNLDSRQSDIFVAEVREKP